MISELKRAFWVSMADELWPEWRLTPFDAYNATLIRSRDQGYDSEALTARFNRFKEAHPELSDQDG